MGLEDPAGAGPSLLFKSDDPLQAGGPEHLVRLAGGVNDPHGPPDLAHPPPGPQQHRDARAVGEGQAAQVQG